FRRSQDERPHSVQKRIRVARRGTGPGRRTDRYARGCRRRIPVAPGGSSACPMAGRNRPRRRQSGCLCAWGHAGDLPARLQEPAGLLHRSGLPNARQGCALRRQPPDRRAWQVSLDHCLAAVGDGEIGLNHRKLTMNTHVTTESGIAISDQALLSLCKASLRLEAAAIAGYSETIGDEFLTALRLLHDARDPVVVAGIGKSGHIARKIASTFRSIGRSAVFLHAAEASHGDLGLIGSQGVVVTISNSGETAELSDLIRYCNLHDVP